MDTKLTLKLDKTVVERAKAYASSQNRSLSGIVETYLRSLTERAMDESRVEDEISSFVSTMKAGVQLPATMDEKEEYSNYLEEKYR